MDYNAVKQRINNYVESQKQDIFKTISELVRIPTLTGQETNGQKYMQELYSSLGLEVILLEAKYEKVSKHKAFVRTTWDYKDRPNIIGILRGEPSARSLILNGHVDVVSPEPVGEWSIPPWEGKIVGNNLYGRGACDTKAGLIASYFALKTLLSIDLKPKGTVILQSVIEEEVLGGGGTLACLIEGFTADGMVVVEPNTMTTLTLASTGILFFRVRVLGKPAHAGLAHTGVNAIGKLNKIYDSLVNLDGRRAKEVHDPMFEKDYSRSCHLNIGTYKAGDSISTVAGWAEIECRMSYIPSEDTNSVKEQVKQVVNYVSQNDEWLSKHPPEMVWLDRRANAWRQDLKHPFVTTLKFAAEQVLGPKVEIVGVPWGMDTRFAPNFNMPAACIGPVGKNFHGINEYVNLDSVLDCTKTLALFVTQWCGV